MVILPGAAGCLLCSSPFGDFVLFFVFILVLAILSTALLAAMQTLSVSRRLTSQFSKDVWQIFCFHEWKLMIIYGDIGHVQSL